MIVITGGGTGGHLSIAKSLAIEFKELGEELIYIGSQKGQDRAWFESSELFKHKYFFDTRGVVNQRFFGKIYSLYLIFKALINIIFIYKKFGIEKVVSVGGFSAAPATLSAILTRKSLYIHEQNSVIGKLNKITKKFAKRFFSSFEEEFVDYPVDNSFFEKARERDGIKTIIFLGGSQGAYAINNLALGLAQYLHQRGIHIIHQAGKNDYERVSEEYKKLGIDVDVFDFDLNLVDKIARADLAVARSGAGTVWELSANRLPAIFIPYPHAAANHQYYNAKKIADKELSYIVLQDEINIENIIDLITKMDIKRMSQGLGQIIEQFGAKKIVIEILK